MVKRPVFSVLLPTHNRADVIGYAIDSVLAQTEQDFELLIVGDGCTDNTAKVVGKYSKDRRVKWFDLPKAPGFGYANRTVVLKQAKGKYVAHMAHDDIMTHDHLQLAGQRLDSHPETDWLYSRPLYVNTKGYMMPVTFNIGDSRTMKFFLTTGSVIPSSNIVHRRKCLDEVGYMNADLSNSADWDLWRRIVRHNPNGWYFNPNPTSLHFLANWRKELKDWHHVVLKDAAVKYQFFPKDLRLKVEPGQLMQKIFWKNMQRDQADFAARVRQSSANLLDGAADFLLAEYKNQGRDLKRLKEENEQYRQKLNKSGTINLLTDAARRVARKTLKPDIRRSK